MTWCCVQPLMCISLLLTVLCEEGVRTSQVQPVGARPCTETGARNGDACLQSCCTFRSGILAQLAWDSKHRLEVDFSNYALNVTNDKSAINDRKMHIRNTMVCVLLVWTIPVSDALCRRGR